MRRRKVRTGTEEIGREEGYNEVWKGPRARSHTLLTLPLLHHTSSLLVFSQLNGNRRRKEDRKGNV